MDPSRRVYDDKDNKAGSDYGDSGGLDKVKNQEKDGSLYNPGGAAKKTADAAKSATDGAKAVASAVAGGGGLAGAATSLAKNSFNWLKSNKKKSAAGAGIIATIFTMLFGMFMLIIPLKIEHVVKNLEKRFFASSQDAMGNMSKKMVKNYIKNKVMPGYSKCGSTINRKCHARVDVKSNNPVSKLYGTWRDKKLENSLADKGMSFERKGNTWRIKYATLNKGNGVDIGPHAELFDKTFDNNKDLNRFLDDSMSGETKWKKVWYRYKIGNLLERKYGIKRCIVFCGSRKAINDVKKLPKEAVKKLAKTYLIERVILPRNVIMGVVMQCFIEQTCNEKTDSQPTDPNDPKTGGEPTTPAENEVKDNFEKDAERISTKVEEKVATREGVEKEIKEKGLNRYLGEKALEKMVGKEASKEILSAAVPVAGQIKIALKIAKVISYIDNATKFLKKLRYIANAASAVQLFTTYQTYTDEIHTGGKDAGEVGSFVSSLGPNNKNSNFDKDQGSLSADQTKDKIKGGVAGAEESPLYGAIMGGKNSIGPKSSFLNPLSPSAYAETASKNSSYRCDDGKPVPKGQYVCLEEQLGGNEGTIGSINSFLHNPVMGKVTAVAHLVNDTVGLAGDLFDFLIGTLTDAFMPVAKAVSDTIDPLCGNVGKFAPYVNVYCAGKTIVKGSEKAISDGLNSIVTTLLPSPFGPDMSGGRNFNMMAAGANVVGNDACAQAGCGQVSKKFVADIINKNQNEEIDRFKQQPFFARIFDTESDYSLVSRVAMATPIGVQSSAQNSFASLMSNPFGGLFAVFGNLFGNKHTFAAASEDTVDVFKIGTFGFDPKAIPDDPEAYWDSHNCDEKIKNWQDESISTPNPDTEMPMHKSPNACMLIKNAVPALGGAMNTDLLSEEDKKHLGTSTASSSSAATDTASENIDMAHLYEPSDKIACAPGSRDIGVQDGYHSGAKVKVRVCAIDSVAETGDTSSLSGANGKLLVNSRLSAFYVKLVKDAQQGGVSGISAAEGFRTMARQRELFAQYGSGRAARPGYSNHQMGLAIDWSEGMISYLQRNPHGLKATVSGEPWHWSPTGN